MHALIAIAGWISIYLITKRIDNRAITKAKRDALQAALRGGTKKQRKSCARKLALSHRK